MDSGPGMGLRLMGFLGIQGSGIGLMIQGSGGDPISLERGYLRMRDSYSELGIKDVFDLACSHLNHFIHQLVETTKMHIYNFIIVHGTEKWPSCQKKAVFGSKTLMLVQVINSLFVGQRGMARFIS